MFAFYIFKIVEKYKQKINFLHFQMLKMRLKYNKHSRNEKQKEKYYLGK